MTEKKEDSALVESKSASSKSLIDPSDFGAKTNFDIGVFLAGGAIGGGLDAVLNVAGFAEPFVFMGICSTGALGLKKCLEGYFESRSASN